MTNCKMEKYWLFLYPDTFLFCESKKVFLYNSISGEGFEVYRRKSINYIIDGLSEINNLYCIEISEEELKIHDVNNLISKVIKTFSGDLIKKTSSKSKPVILPPILNLQKDIEKLRKDMFRSTGENILAYLNEINIYLDTIWTNKNIKDSQICKITIDFEQFRKFISQMNYNSLSEVNLYSKNCVDFDYLQILLIELFKYSSSIILNMPIYSIINIKNYHTYHNLENFKFRFIIESDFDELKVSDIINTISKYPLKYELLFLVSSMNEFMKADNIIEKTHETNIEVKPFYKNKNMDFFEKNIYLTNEELTKPKITKQEIYIHQVINTNDFGKLTISNTGVIYSNINFPPIGSIKDDLSELIYLEMDNGNSWRRIRNMLPCSDCIYQWLCPSPSNYELMIGKPNLCHIK